MNAQLLLTAAVLYLGIYGVAVVVKLFKSFAPAKQGTQMVIDHQTPKSGTGYLQ